MSTINYRILKFVYGTYTYYVPQKKVFKLFWINLSDVQYEHLKNAREIISQDIQKQSISEYCYEHCLINFDTEKRIEETIYKTSGNILSTRTIK